MGPFRVDEHDATSGPPGFFLGGVLGRAGHIWRRGRFGIVLGHVATGRGGGILDSDGSARAELSQMQVLLQAATLRQAQAEVQVLPGGEG